MNNCTRGATSDMSNTKLLENPNGTKSDLLQLTLETQLRVWRMCSEGQMCQVSLGTIWWDGLDGSCCVDYVVLRCAQKWTGQIVKSHNTEKGDFARLPAWSLHLGAGNVHSSGVKCRLVLRRAQQGQCRPVPEGRNGGKMKLIPLARMIYISSIEGDSPLY